MTEYFLVSNHASVCSREIFSSMEEAESALKSGQYHIQVCDYGDLEIMEYED